MKNIPITEYGWLDYFDGKIFIIEESKDGNLAKYQYDGTSCLQGQVKGFIADEFKSSSKWFNADWWYTKTTWGSYPKKIYFTEGKTPIEQNKYEISNPNIWDKTNKIADTYGRPAEKILKAILTEVYVKTDKEYAFDFDNFDYGVSWAEAHIPLEYKGKKFLLTWSNCD
jgi:hypothetical protein